MKLVSLPTLALICIALVFSTVSAEAKSNHRGHHHANRHHANRHHAARHHATRHHTSRHHATRHHDIRRHDIRRHANRHNDYRRHDYRVNSGRHYHRGHERRVVFYQNRSYGYNYYDLQRVLLRDGYYHGPLDGVWGSECRSALIRYESDHGWQEDGRIDGQLIVNLGIGL